MIGISGIDASAEKDSCGCFVASGFTDGRASILWGTLLIVASGATTRNWSAKRTYRSEKEPSVKILDLTAGNRAVWFDKNHPLAVYLDKRESVKPTIVCDIRNIPESVGSGFNLVVFDPPHMNTGKTSNMARVYGHHTTAEILRTVELAGSEAHRVTAPNALMALKWNTHDIKLEKVFMLLGRNKWEPLFGHLTKDGPRSQTYWTMLRRVG